MTTKTAAVMAVLVAWAAASFAGEPIPLDQAVREGKIWVHVSSLGGSTGNAIDVNIKRMVNQQIQISVNPGTVFVAAGADVQRMVAASVQGVFVNGAWQTTHVIELNDNLQHDYLLESYCIDYEKPAPRFGDVFTLNVCNEQVKKVLDVAVTQRATPVDVQVAIWMFRERARGVEVNVGELKTRFPAATDQNIVAARNLLVNVQAGAAVPAASAATPGAVPAQGTVPPIAVTQVQTGGVFNIPGVNVQVDTRPGGTGVHVGGYGFNVNVNAPAPPPRAAADATPALQVLNVNKTDKYVVGGRGLLKLAGNTQSAAPDKTFLIMTLAIDNPGSDLTPEKFSVQIDGQSVPAKMVSMGPALLAPNQPPRLTAPLRSQIVPGGLAAMVGSAARYQVVFEVPKLASQGTLRWADRPEVHWSTPEAGLR